MITIHAFPAASGAEPLPALADVGGKGLSLMKMSRSGLPVPPGFVLPVAFFAPWIEALRARPAFDAFTRAGEAELKAASDALKAESAELPIDPAQRAAVDQALASWDEGALFAVRSSSPEEDLEGASFAGGYETVLGVTRERLWGAIRRAFASCLDARVAIYKREHGFDPRSPRIAVVVQQQIASEVAGVGFSLDPVTNDHDVAVFNANFGLGETVVAGLASPDLFVVDKPSRKIASRVIGRKETSIWLVAGGGTEERPDPRSAEASLSDAQILELADEMARVEELYGRPMDIEWAFAGGRLYVLQARPITTSFELPEDLVTKPGEPRRVYWDVTISVQGFLKPMSPFATSLFRELLGRVTAEVSGRDLAGDKQDAIVQVTHGRLYGNLVNVLALVGKENFVRGIGGVIDAEVGRAVEALDLRALAAPSAWISSVRRGALRRAPKKAKNLAESLIRPEAAYARVRRAVDEFEATARAAREGDDLAAIEDLVEPAGRLVFEQLIPAIAASKIAMARIRALFPSPSAEQRAWIERLDQSLPHNVTVEMGLTLARIAERLPLGMNAVELERRLADRAAEPRLPAGFLREWDAFLDRYGHRGPGEIDAAEPRWREQPRLLLQQIAQVAALRGTDRSPIAIYERSQAERRAAYEALAAAARAKGVISARLFAQFYRVVEALGGLRETPKFCLILIFDVARRRALAAAQRLVAAGRLDREAQIFDLGLDEIARGLADPRLDLRALAAANRAAYDRLARVRDLPRLIDSRGKILRAPAPPPKPGELTGSAVSNGVVRGRVKVLHAPDEKPLLPGEILVARATDPGWTPLFVNAAAVVLEVGGMMQHGALVAREYGKPCVAGVDHATTRLTDGALIEVDGGAGIVRLLEPAATA